MDSRRAAGLRDAAMMSRKMGIGDRLREVRTNLGLTQPEVAARMGVSNRAYQTYEAGERQPKAADLAGLHGEGIDLNWLLTGEGGMYRNPPLEALPVVDEDLLCEALKLVEDWLTANRRTMAPAKKAEVVIGIYSMASEDAAEGKPLEARRVAHILKLVG